MPDPHAPSPDALDAAREQRDALDLAIDALLAEWLPYFRVAVRRLAEQGEPGWMVQWVIDDPTMAVARRVKLDSDDVGVPTEVWLDHFRQMAGVTIERVLVRRAEEGT